MAKLEGFLRGELAEILSTIDQGLLEGSTSASYEDGSDFSLGDVACVVRVYERYSLVGGNRVSLNITLFGRADCWQFSAVTSGGSRAVFFKMDTIGEETFQQELNTAIARFRI